MGQSRPRPMNALLEVNESEALVGGGMEDESRAGPGAALVCDECWIVEEAHHRVANHLALIAGYIRMASSEFAAKNDMIPERSVRLLLEQVIAQLLATSRLHRSWSLDGVGASVDLSDHLRTVFEPFVKLLSKSTVLVEDFGPGCLLMPDQVLPLTQLVTEIVTNAAKHGGGGTVSVSTRATGAAGVIIEVADEGPGFPEGFDPYAAHGLGLRLVRSLTHQLRAHIEFDSRPAGLLVRLTMPSAA